MSTTAVPPRASAYYLMRTGVVAIATIMLGLALAPTPASAAPLYGEENAHFLQAGVPIYPRHDSGLGCVLGANTCDNDPDRDPTDLPARRYSEPRERVRALCYIGTEMKIIDRSGYPSWTPVSQLVLHESGIGRCGWWS